MVNVLGRDKLLPDDFLEIVKNFDARCAKEEVSILVLNTFLDAIIQANTYKTDATIRKTLCNEKYCYNIRRQILRVIDPKESDTNIKDPNFMNNYCGLFRALVSLEIMPLEIMEKQVNEFIYPRFDEIADYNSI